MSVFSLSFYTGVYSITTCYLLHTKCVKKWLLCVMIPRQILKFISSTPLFSTAQEEDRCNLEDFEETEMHSLL